MEWIEALGGTIVGLDTAPLIYLIEETPIFLPFVRPFFEVVDRGDFRGHHADAVPGRERHGTGDMDQASGEIIARVNAMPRAEVSSR